MTFISKDRFVICIDDDEDDGKVDTERAALLPPKTRTVLVNVVGRVSNDIFENSGHLLTASLSVSAIDIPSRHHISVAVFAVSYPCH